jgi:hypothetical protein
VNLSALRLISGAGQTDTILAVLPQTLVVEVHDSAGALAVGDSVRFRPVSSASVSRIAPMSFGAVASVAADGQGRAQCVVKLGSYAGTALVEAAAPALGVVDTFAFTVTHGAPARLTISPRDTGLAPGGSFTLKVLEITDQASNPITGLVPTFSATDASVTSSGEVTVPNTSPLQAKVVASYQQASDTALVSVYPRIPMVVARYGGGSSVVLINSDGTGSVDVAATPDASIAPSSVAATPNVVYYRGDPSANSKVWVAQPNATPHVLLPGETRPEAWPRLSPDGTWVYFVRDAASLWRAKLDGTGLDSLTAFTSSRTYQAPTVSPDGRFVAIEDGNALQIVDVTAKSSSTLPITCPYPSYSPDGAYFACTTLAEVSVVRTDGTDRRIVHPTGGLDPYSSIDWTADGKWLLVMFADRYAALIEVSTDTVIPLRALPAGAFQPMFVR